MYRLRQIKSTLRVRWNLSRYRYKNTKSFNPLLKNEGFIGFEDVKGNVIASCVIAAKQLHPFIQECMQYYNQDFTIEIINKNEANVIDITQRLIKKGMQLGGGEQVINEMHIYPREYFCPMDFGEPRSLPA